jgi:hypothetical protein
MMGWAGHVEWMMGVEEYVWECWWGSQKEWRKKKAYTTWEDNIKKDLWETGWDGEDWINFADRDQWCAVVNTVLNLWVP